MDDLVILQKIYDMILWATPIVENYPRSKRFTLGTYTQNAMLELLKCVIEANKLRYRQHDPKQRTARIEAIRRADVQLALLTYYLHLDLNSKTTVRSVSQGVEWLGYRVWPTHIRLRKSTAQKMLKHCNSYRLQRKLEAEIGKLN